MRDFSNISEDKLIDMAVEGDEEAWQEIYRLYYHRVRRVVAWGKWNFKHAEVEEIVQEVFLELVKALPKFRKEASLNTFLTRLSKNKCISALRRKGALKRAKEEYNFAFDEIPSDEETRWVYVESKMGNPEESLLFGEDAKMLLSAIKELSPDCQEIIKKRYFDDLSYNEICEALNLPLGTVCSRLKRCLMKLKKVYEKRKSQ